MLQTIRCYCAFIVTLSSLLAASSFGAFAQDDKVTKVTFIFAGELLDISDPQLGAYSQLKHLYEQEKLDNPATFLYFLGGSIGPSALSNLDRGSHIVDILNSVEPDVMAVSKRDYSYSENELSLRSFEAAFPMVASNLRDTRTNETPDGLVRSAIVTKQNVSVGFISLMDERLINEYLLSYTEVLSAKDSMIELSEALRKQGADIIVVQSFYPFDFFESMLEDNIIDLAANSDTHISKNILKQFAGIEKLSFFSSPGKAIIIDAGLTSELTIAKVTEVDLSSGIKDAELTYQIDAYNLRLDRLLNDVIATWKGDYSTRREDIRAKENAFGNYLADTMREFADTDVAILNSGGIRGDNHYSSGSRITLKTIASELPYRPTLTTISISGKDLLAALENGVSNIAELRGKYPHISGIRMVYDSNKPAGNRIDSVMINGQALQADKYYSLATTEYLANGGDEYDSLPNATQLTRASIKNTILISDLVLRDIRVKGVLESTIDGRSVDMAQVTENNE